MPNNFLHPSEIKRFYELYAQFRDHPDTQNNDALTREFQTLIQKIDYENNPLTDEFKLVADGNNVEESFERGIDGDFGINTATAANAAKRWLDKAIADGRIEDETTSDNSDLEEHHAFDVNLGHKSMLLVNLNGLLQRAHLNSTKYGKVSADGVHSKTSVQGNSKINPFDQKSEFGQAYFDTYIAIIDEFKNDQDVLDLLNKASWEEADRELWEEKLFTYANTHFQKNPLFEHRFGQAISDVNKTTSNTQFICNEQQLTLGSLIQIIENQMLSNQSDASKQPGIYYKISLDLVADHAKHGGNHTVIISEKTGNISNSVFIHNEHGFIDFIDGVCVFDETYEDVYSNRIDQGDGIPEPKNDTLATRDNSTKAQDLLNEAKHNPTAFKKKIDAVASDLEQAREKRIQEIIEDKSETVAFGLWEDEYISSGELEDILKELEEEVLAASVRVINNDGADNDQLIINGKTHKVKLDNDIPSGPRIVF